MPDNKNQYFLAIIKIKEKQVEIYNFLENNCNRLNN